MQKELDILKEELTQRIYSSFMNKFNEDYKILLDPIYTGKMVFGVIDLINKDYFPENSKILMVHTGGIQGIAGINKQLENKQKQLIIR